MATLEEARNLAAQGEYQHALEMTASLYKDHKDASPNEKADWLVFMGACYMALEQYPDAKFCYSQAQEFNPDHPKIRIAMAGLGGVLETVPALLGGISATMHKPKSDTETDLEADYVPAPEPRPISHIYNEANDDVWAKAFPDTPVKKSSGMGSFIVSLIVLGAIAWVLYQIFGPAPAP